MCLSAWFQPYLKLCIPSFSHVLCQLTRVDFLTLQRTSCLNAKDYILPHEICASEAVFDLWQEELC